jgi:CheY-like chemotaxis protein
MPLSPKPRRIAFADDDPDDHYVFFTALKNLDNTIEVIHFYRCQDLFEYLRNNELPDYLFLDLNMPGNEDFKCLIEIKNHHIYKNIPVIVYTTSNKTDVEKLAFQVGANRYVVKPASVRELQVILKDIVVEPRL